MRSSGSRSVRVLAALVELVLIRPLYERPIEQVLVTVGLALVLGALWSRRSGASTRASSRCPTWLIDTTTILGANIPNDRFLEIAPPCSSSSA